MVEAWLILIKAVQNMSFDDARTILADGDDAAPQYFRRSTSVAPGESFLPIARLATVRRQAAEQDNQYAGQAATPGLPREKDTNLDSYVTQKALDGLFRVIAQQEKAIRQDPPGSSSLPLQTVFGAALG